MSFCVQLHLHQRRVLVVGGGKAALRKVQQCLDEGAIVSVLALDFLEAFHELTIHRLQAQYTIDAIMSFDMVIAATNDVQINARIIRDANNQRIMSMSMDGNQDAQLHSMNVVEGEHYVIAASTKHTFPAMCAVMTSQIQEMMEEHYKPRLAILKALRKRLIKVEPNKARVVSICRELTQVEVPLLQFLRTSFQKQRVLILAFHGVHDINIIEQDVLPFVAQLQLQYPAYAIHFVYVADGVKAHLGTTVLDLDTLLGFLHAFAVDVIKVCPMLLQEGHYLKKIERSCNNYQNIEVLPLPFAGTLGKRALIDELLAAYKQADTWFVFVYHASVASTLPSIMDDEEKTVKQVAIVHEKQLMAMKETFMNASIQVYPLYMLRGYHFKKDTNMLGEIQRHWKANGCRVSCFEHSVLNDPVLQRLLIERIDVR